MHGRVASGACIGSKDENPAGVPTEPWVSAERLKVRTDDPPTFSVIGEQDDVLVVEADNADGPSGLEVLGVRCSCVFVFEHPRKASMMLDESKGTRRRQMRARLARRR